MDLKTFWKKAESGNIPFAWVDVHDKLVCPDCFAIAVGQPGTGLSWEQWKAFGVPGAGHTVCQKKCRCRLVPILALAELSPGVEDIQKFLFGFGNADSTANLYATAVEKLRNSGVDLDLFGLSFAEQVTLIDKEYNRVFGGGISE